MGQAKVRRQLAAVGAAPVSQLGEADFNIRRRLMALTRWARQIEGVVENLGRGLTTLDASLDALTERVRRAVTPDASLSQFVAEMDAIRAEIALYVVVAAALASWGPALLPARGPKQPEDGAA